MGQPSGGSTGHNVNIQIECAFTLAYRKTTHVFWLLQDPKYYEYMKSYSPVDNIGTNGTEYPNILVTAGLHDPRV